MFLLELIYSIKEFSHRLYPCNECSSLYYVLVVSGRKMNVERYIFTCANFSLIIHCSSLQCFLPSYVMVKNCWLFFLIDSLFNNTDNFHFI